MSNSYYNHTTYPTPNSPGSSAALRAELEAITDGFDLLPTLTGNGYKVAMINSAGTALIASSALQALAITSSTIDSTPIGATTAAAGTFTTLAASSGTIGGANIVTTTATQTLTNKTLTSPVISTIVNTGTLTLPTSSDTLVGRATTDTLTNKTISGSTNTLSNIANASLTNSSITIGSTSVSLGGTAATVAGLTLTTPVLSATASGTAAGQLGYSGGVLSFGDGSAQRSVATLDNTQTLTNKTISGSSNTLSNIANSSLTNSSVTIGSTSVALGATVTTFAGLTSVTSTTFVGALTGNADTVTNGVYTTGSYSNPSWITALAGSKISGNITGNAANVTGTVAVANGGTGSTTAAAARAALFPSFTGNAGKAVVVNAGATDIEYITLSGTGTVTSVDVSGGTTGLTTSGGPITTTGTITLAGTLAIANGGTGATTASDARTSLAVAGTAVSNTFSANQIVSVTDNTNAALRITQLGTANALLVEDSTNPDSTPFVIDATGVVVVGHTAAVGGSKLQVADTTSNAALAISAWRSASSGGGAILLNKSRSGTPGTYSIVSSGDTLSTIRFNGDDGVGFIAAAEITAAVDGTPGTSDMPGRLMFSTTADGASSATEWMRIGSTGAIGFNSTTTLGGSSGRFRFGGNITGAAGSTGVLYTPTIQSDVTSSATIFNSQPSTVDAAFTLGTLTHFQANQSTITGGSRTAPTNQIGFQANSTLTGATNNYGFKGDIASGTGRWNVYMAGTAANYFAGNVGIGTTTPGSPLEVVGTVSATTFSGAGTSLTGTAASLSIGGTAANVTGTVAVANGGTGLTSGTSGGVLYYSATGTLASSAALAASALVLGGGAGVAPSTTTTGTGVVTAIGNAVNTAGGLVTVDGSVTLTNKTLGSGTVLGAAVTGTDAALTRVMLQDTGWNYFDSSTTNALNYTNGSHQRWAPATGAQTLTISNWPPSGDLGELLIEGVNLGASTITWPTINWIKSDGTTTTTFSGSGVILQSSGTDWVFLWTRDAGTTIYGKVVR